MKRKYEVINHTADLGLRVFGDTREDLFANAAAAMFAQIADLEQVRPHIRRSLKVEAPNREELLVRFLSELLYLFTSGELLPGKFKIQRMDDQHIEAEVWGKKFSSSLPPLKTEIKAVTYHNLKIDHDKTGWRSEIIFDV